MILQLERLSKLSQLTEVGHLQLKSNTSFLEYTNFIPFIDSLINIILD